jgi:uncharacterized protein (DUF1501 family)
MSSPFPSLCNANVHLSRRSLVLSASGSLFLGPLAKRLAAAQAEPGSDPSRPKSVILLWLEGGPSQLETFDPHAGTKIGGQVKAIATSAKGIEIANTLPQLAEQMHHGTLIRSVVGKEGDHERAVYNIKTGYRPDPTLLHPSLGAIVCHEINEGADIPRHVSILPGSAPARGGYLGAKYDAFKIGDPAGPVPDVTPRVEQERYDARIDDLMNVVEAKFARRRLQNSDAQRTLHAVTTQRALTMMSSEQLNAFDVMKEPASVRENFGDTSFGRGCLAAVRLIEVGVRCVEVTLGGWDSHINNHSLQSSACQNLDAAAASLIRLLDERDLLENTVVVIGGEFGRTPSINPAEGRDHWPHGFSVMLAGCGIRKGSVYGATAADADFDADKPASNVSDPVSVADVHATILKAVGIEHEKQFDTPIGRPMFISEGKPIEKVLA